MPVLASRQLDEQNSFPGSAGHVQRGFAHDFSAIVYLLLPFTVMPHEIVWQAVFNKHGSQIFQVIIAQSSSPV